MATNLAAAVAFAAGLCVSAFAAASTVTMDFSGDVVITGNGGPADYSFSGSLTWDPASALVSSGCFEGGLSCYPASATFVFDSTDDTADIVNPSILLPAPPNLFEFGFDFSPFIFLSGVPSPITRFIGTAFCNSQFSGLPSDLTVLLTQCALSSSFSLGEGEFATFADGSLKVTAPPTTPPGGSVPEPGSLMLMVSSLGALVVTKRRLRPTAVRPALKAHR